MDSLGVTPAPETGPAPQPADRRELFPAGDGAARERRLTEEWTARLAELNTQLADRDSQIVTLKVRRCRSWCVVDIIGLCFSIGNFSILVT